MHRLTPLVALAGVRKQSCIMRRCVRMNSNGGGSSSSSSHILKRNVSNSSLSTLSVLDGADSYCRTRSGDSEQAAAAAMLLGFGGGAPMGDDDAPTRGTRSYHESSSSSPRYSPTHSAEYESDERGGTFRRTHGEYSYGEYGPPRPRPRPPILNSGGMTGADSFCCKLATVLASDKRLGSQPIALRALQKAGIVEANDNPGGLATSSADLTSSLMNPSLAPHLCTGLASLTTASQVSATASPSAGILGLQRPAASPNPSAGGASLSNGAASGIGLHVRQGLISGGVDGTVVGVGGVGGAGGGAASGAGLLGRGLGSSSYGVGGGGGGGYGHTEGTLHSLLSMVAQSEMAARGMPQLPFQQSVMPRVVPPSNTKSRA